MQPGETILATERHTLSLAGSAAELEAAQRLRYAVFNRELGEGLSASEALGRDADEFDAVCEHLLVRLRKTGEVIGTYRLQTGSVATQSGLGYYSAREFDLASFAPKRAEILELGLASRHDGDRAALAGHRALRRSARRALFDRLQFAHLAL
jgi:putative hemolysin